MSALLSSALRHWRVALASLAVIGLVLAGLLVAGRTRPTPSRRVPISATRDLLGTWVTITVLAADESSGQEFLAAGFDRIASLERSLGAQQPDSELTRVNREAGREPVPVSEDLFAVIRAGVEWHGRTAGAFDIAISPLLDLWRSCGKANRLPTPEEIERLKPLLGANRIALNPAQRTVRLPVEGMRLDLGGLGKGYCADEAVKRLQARGVTCALVAVAGDIYALGTREDGRPWRVGVQDPRDPDSPDAMLTVLGLSDRAVSTSGNYQRYVEIRGHRYSHIVDPRTGWPADTVPGVTVIGPDTLTTDILGTALSVLGIEEGLALVEKMEGVEALFVTLGPENAPQLIRTSGFSRYEAAGRR